MLVGVADVIDNCGNYGMLKLMPKKELEKIGNGEHNLHVVENVQCITVPFAHYFKILMEAQNGKRKRK
jgi:hypothetical protein